MTRIFEAGHIWQVTDQQVDAASDELATRSSRRWSVDGVIGVGRGGVRSARRIAARLALPVYTVHARANRTEAVRSAALASVEICEPELLELPALSTYLVVDDICGSGNTLAAVKEAILAADKATHVHTVTLCKNAGSAIDPDLWAWTVNDWVWFPWEPRPREGHIQQIGTAMIHGRSA